MSLFHRQWLYCFDLICLMYCKHLHDLISPCSMKSVEVNLVYHIRLAHPLASLYQGTIKSLNAAQFSKIGFRYQCGPLWIISLTTAEGLAVFSVSLTHPRTLENLFIGIDAHDAMCLAGVLTFAGIFLAHSCLLQTHWLLSIKKWARMPPDRECLFLLCSLQLWCVGGVTGALFV